MAITLVQTSVEASGANVTSLTTPAFSAGVTPGNSVVVAVMAYCGVTTDGTQIFVGDSWGNLYTCLHMNGFGGTDPNGTNTGETVGFWIANVAGGGTLSTTVEFFSADGGLAHATIVACEIAGTGSTVDTSQGSNGGSSPVKTGTFQTFNANDIVFTGFCSYNVDMNAVGPPSFCAPNGGALYGTNEDGTSLLAGFLGYGIQTSTVSSSNYTIPGNSATFWASCTVAVEAGGPTPVNGVYLLNGRPVIQNGLPATFNWG